MEKNVLFKKLKRKFIKRKEIYKKYYKKYLELYVFLKDVANPKSLKPARGYLRKYQLELLDFCFECFEKIEALGLEYFFIGGNLLGAYRNNSFIPWDDDIDIGMIRKDYEKLYQYLKENCSEMESDEIFQSKRNKWVIVEKYLKQKPDTVSFVRFPTHIQMFIGKNINDIKCLDIHPYDYYSDDLKIEDLAQYLGEIKAQIRKIDNFKLTCEYLERERANNPNIVDNSNKIYCGIDHWDATHFPCVKWFSYSDIYPISKVNFENKKISIPNNIAKFLELTYGLTYDDMPKSFEVLEHRNFRQRILAESGYEKKKQISTPRALLIKKIKRKFASKEEKYKKLYKKIKPKTDFLLDIVDIKSMNPTKDKTLRQMQLKVVDFAKEITDFLDEQKLSYFLNGGSLIGALRHQGFVPWDDDFDVGLMREDYEKLKEILPKYFKIIDISKVVFKKSNKNEIVHEELKKSNGEIICFIGPRYIQMYRGNSLASCAMIDIFPHDYYRDDYTIAEHEKYLDYINLQIKKINKYPKIMEFLKKEIKNSPNIVQKSNKIHYAIDNYGSYVTKSNTFMTYDMIFPLKKMKFEGYEFNVPNDSDTYIKVQYKNYMQMPSNIAIAPDLKIRKQFES